MKNARPPLPVMRARYVAPSVIYLAALLHLSWGLLLLVAQETAGATPVHGLRQYFVTPTLTAIILIGAGLLAFLNLAPHWPGPRSKRSIAVLVPQQLLLLISLGTALGAMWSGQYADGVQRPHAFVIADQMPIALISLWHSFALLNRWGKLAVVEVVVP